MNKKLITFISIVTISALAAGCGAGETNSGIKPQKGSSSQTASSTETSDTEITTDDLLSEKEAKKIALEDAEVSEQDVSHIQVELDKDDRIPEYEVEFYADGQEYDYTLRADTGEILSKDKEIEKDFNTGNSNFSDNVISEKEARKIALAKVDGASKNNIHLELDWEDGHQVYEGSIYHNDIEYEFEIDASDGKILSWEEESIYD